MKAFKAGKAVEEIAEILVKGEGELEPDGVIVVALLDLVRAAEIISAQLEEIYMAIPEGPDEVERWEVYKRCKASE